MYKKKNDDNDNNDDINGDDNQFLTSAISPDQLHVVASNLSFVNPYPLFIFYA